MSRRGAKSVKQMMTADVRLGGWRNVDSHRAVAPRGQPKRGLGLPHYAMHQLDCGDAEGQLRLCIQPLCLQACTACRTSCGPRRQTSLLREVSAGGTATCRTRAALPPNSVSRTRAARSGMRRTVAAGWGHAFPVCCRPWHRRKQAVPCGAALLRDEAWRAERRLDLSAPGVRLTRR